MNNSATARLSFLLTDGAAPRLISGDSPPAFLSASKMARKIPLSLSHKYAGRTRQASRIGSGINSKKLLTQGGPVQQKAVVLHAKTAWGWASSTTQHRLHRLAAAGLLERHVLGSFRVEYRALAIPVTHLTLQGPVEVVVA